jgi:O-antigen/teichoic acid export membrane protein
VEPSSLTFQTFKNISYNVVGYVWPMFFALFVTPIIIFRLGVKNYGIYIFLNTVIGFLGLIDFGIGTAVSKYLAFYYGKKDFISITKLTNTANSLFLIIGTFGFIIAAVIALFGPAFLMGQFSSYAQYSFLFFIAGGIFFFNSVCGTYGSILNAVQRFDIRNMIGISSLTVSSLGILAIVLLGGSLQMIFIFQLILNFFIAATTFYYGKKVLPAATTKFAWDKGEVRKCYNFGLIAFVNNIAATALSSLDRLIIPFFVGPSNLTYYSVPGSVTSRIPGFANTLSATIFPTTSQLDGGDDRIRIEALYIRSFRLITIMAAAMTVTAASFAYKILFFWLNADFASHSTDILIILALTNFILALMGPLSNFLLGLGKLKFLTAMSITMGVLNAILLVILLPRYGITGAAWAYLVSILPTAYMFYYAETHYLALSGRKKYYTKKIVGTVLVSAAIWAIDTFLLSPFIVDRTTLLIVGGTSIVGYILFYKILGLFEMEDWRDMSFFFGEILRRIGLKKLTLHL